VTAGSEFFPGPHVPPTAGLANGPKIVVTAALMPTIANPQQMKPNHRIRAVVAIHLFLSLVSDRNCDVGVARSRLIGTARSDQIGISF